MPSVYSGCAKPLVTEIITISHCPFFVTSKHYRLYLFFAGHRESEHSAQYPMRNCYYSESVFLFLFSEVAIGFCQARTRPAVCSLPLDTYAAESKKPYVRRQGDPSLTYFRPAFLVVSLALRSPCGLAVYARFFFFF